MDPKQRMNVVLEVSEKMSSRQLFSEIREFLTKVQEIVQR